MTMKSKLVSFIAASFLASVAFANQHPECPDINAIKLEGLTMFEKILSNLFFTYHTSQYGTQSDWALVMAPIEADSGVLALSRGNEILASMSEPGVPLNEQRIFMCQYATGQHHVKVVAVLADILISPTKIGNLFKIS